MKFLLTIIIGLVGLTLWCNTDARIYDAPKNMDSTAEWDNFSAQLLRDPDNNIIIRWEGVGGFLTIKVNFVKTLDELRAHDKNVTIMLIGWAISAQALVVCCADHVVWGPYGFLMFHPPSLNDRPNEASLGATWDVYRGVEQCVEKGILTEREARWSVRNKEVYVKQRENGTYKVIIREDLREGANK